MYQIAISSLLREKSMSDEVYMRLMKVLKDCIQLHINFVQLLCDISIHLSISLTEGYRASECVLR